MSYIKYIMDNIDIYIYTHECCLFCGITCLKKLSKKVPKDGSIPGKFHRIFEAMFPFLEAAYP